MTYPGSTDSFTTKTAADQIASAHINAVQAAIAAIETALGLNPQGSQADLVTRLARLLTSAGDLAIANQQSVSISGGTITPTANSIRVDTEGSASSDDLDNIVMSTSGYVLFLRAVNDGRNVVIRHNVGNILCPGGGNITLDYTNQTALLIYDGNLSKWLVLSAANCGLLNIANAWTAENTWQAAENHAITSVSADTTLNATHHTVKVDATGAARTITLPAAASCSGRVYIILKVDSSGNTVTIDGDASETINGSTTKVLSSQWEKCTIQSDGANWIEI